MIAEYQKIIGFRLSTKEREQLEALVIEGKVKTISAGIRLALADFLKKQ